MAINSFIMIIILISLHYLLSIYLINLMMNLYHDLYVNDDLNVINAMIFNVYAMAFNKYKYVQVDRWVMLLYKINILWLISLYYKFLYISIYLL